MIAPINPEKATSTYRTGLRKQGEVLYSTKRNLDRFMADWKSAYDKNDRLEQTIDRKTKREEHLIERINEYKYGAREPVKKMRD